MTDERDTRDIRDRVIRLETKSDAQSEEIKGLKKMVWAPIWLVLGAVGAALMKMLGIGS
jgi:hypothetical protein